MDTKQIACALKDVRSFLGVFPSDLLPHSIPQTTCTVIINTDPHTESGSHWLAVHFEPRSSSAYYFDSFGRPPHIPTIQEFLRRNCTVQEYNAIQLQGPSTTLCGHYCCLFALHMDIGETPKRFVSLFNPVNADDMVARRFKFQFGPIRRMPRGGQCCTSLNKW
jgi:hypothetical protein